MRCRITSFWGAWWATVMAAALTGATQAAGQRPNFVVILLDDLGYSDLGCFGGEIRTPNIDRLAAGGLRFTRFYNASRCCPTRAALLTGLYPHQVGLARNGRDLTRDGATIAELLRTAGYQTAMMGKWHLSATIPLDGNARSAEQLAWLNHQAGRDRPFAGLETYPVNRGFERFYGTIWGVVNYFDPFSLVEGTEPVKDVPADYYLSDAITEKSVAAIRVMARDDRPFFLYVAHCAPHWPLHARPEDVVRYHDTYRQGWHALREAHYRRQVEIGLFDPATHPLPALMGHGPDWDRLDAERRGHESALMAVHAAMVDRVNQGVGAIIQVLKDTNRYEDTVVVVLADNGASAERFAEPGFDRPSETRDGRPIRYVGRFEPGPETTWGYIGSYWANAANTPYRYWKAEEFEGGCHTPMIVQWPKRLECPAGSITAQIGHVIDLVPTFLELAAAAYPAQYVGHDLKPLAGRSLAPILHGRPRAGHPALFFEHEGGRAVHTGDWKLVARSGGAWELYHVAQDATETRNLADRDPQRVAELARMWRAWAMQVGAAIPAGSGRP